MARALMELPAELRLMIFEYALSEEKGLTYHEDEQLIGWLCLHQSTSTSETKSNTVTSALHDEEAHNVRKRRKLNDGSSQETTDLDPQAPVRIRGFTVANQLQFVSKQMRHETKGLSLRYNDVHIFDSMSHIKSLFHSLSPRQASWIRKVVVRAEHGWDAKLATGVTSTTTSDGSWKEILESCPQLTVHVYSPDVRVDTGSYFLMALIIQHRGRGNTTFHQRLSSDRRMQRILSDLIETSTAERPRLANWVKLFPWDMTFDAKAFGKACLLTDKLVPILSAIPGFRIEDLTAIAEEWVTHGF